MFVHSFWPIILGLLSILIWAYLLLAHGQFWQTEKKVVPQIPQAAKPARVAVIVPARNEAEVISESIVSLLKQSSDGLVRIFLVDDGSVDETAQLAREAARKTGRSDLLTIIPGQPLPPGWSGKLWALQQGIQSAREVAPDYFLFTDADIVHAPESIATLVRLAESHNYDLASFMVKLHCESLAEKLLIPAFVFFFFKLYPPKWISDPHRATAGAAGGCILIRPEALARAGGIEAIRGELIDDCALARHVKQSGGKIWLGLTASTFSTRPYQSFAEIGIMISRTAFNQLHHSALILFGALLGLVLTYLLPIALLFSGNRIPAILGAIAWILMTIAYLPMVRFYKLNFAWAISLPFAALFYMGATLHSAIKYWFGSGGQWKGRVQDPIAS